MPGVSEADSDAVRFHVGSLPGSAASVHVVAQGTAAHWQSERSPRTGSQKQVSGTANAAHAAAPGSSRGYVRQANSWRSQTGSGADAAGGRPGESTTATPAIRPLPPLCSGGALPSHETRFSVPVDTLAVAGDNDLFDVLDLTDDFGMRVQALPCAGPQAGPGLAVYRGRQSKDSSAIVRRMGPGQSAADSRLELRSADGSVYGVLAPQADSSFLLTRGDQVLLAITGDDQDMQLHVTSGDGAPMARMTDSMAAVDSPSQLQQPRSEEHVQFVVLAGADPVLVIASVLSVLLFGLEVDDPPSRTKLPLGAS